MQWDRFEQKKSKAARGHTPAAVPTSADPNRHLRELNNRGPAAQRRNRKAIPRQLRGDLERQLVTILDIYPEGDKKKRDSAEMGLLLSKVMTTQQEYELAADRLDTRRGGFFSALGDVAGNILVFAFDWVLLTVSFFIVFNSVTEKWRPQPEFALLVGVSTFLALMTAAMVKALAKLAYKYKAPIPYALPFAGAAFADLYYLNKQHNLNVGFFNMGLLAGLCALNFLHARHQLEQPLPRKTLLDDYADKYELFSQHYFLWEKNLDEMRDPLTADVRSTTLVFKRASDEDPKVTDGTPAT